MHEINVFFKPGGVVEVDRPLAGIHSGADIIWQFHSVDASVRWAAVEFTDPGATYFANRGGGRVARRYTAVDHGHGSIPGTAPELVPSPDSRLDKYWVKGYGGTAPPAASAVAVSELDPEIIVCDP